MAASWLLLRQIREALKNGRPESAHPLVRQLADLGHKAAFRYEADVARCYLERAERSLAIDDIESAWDDLRQAESLGYTGPEAGRVRERLTRLALVELRAMLEAGRPTEVEQAIEMLRERGLRHPDLDPIGACARVWGEGLELADAGELARAVEKVEAARPKLPCPSRGLDQNLAELAERRSKFEAAVARMRESAERGHWRQVLSSCDEVFAVAPNHDESRQARAAAWQRLSDPTVSMVGTANPTPAEADHRDDSTGDGLPRRFFLWFDGVGGFLVCTSSRVTIGQAGGVKPVDLPVSAGLAAVHATLLRDEEGYTLESGRDVMVNGEPLNRSIFLRHGSLVTLGKCCQFRFAQPSPISTSAAIHLTSNHRLPEALDGALLMAQALVFGSGPDCHVVVPELPKPVMLVRSGIGLAVQHAAVFSVNRGRVQDHAILEVGRSVCSVSGEEFSFSLEPVPPKFATI